MARHQATRSQKSRASIQQPSVEALHKHLIPINNHCTTPARQGSPSPTARTGRRRADESTTAQPAQPGSEPKTNPSSPAPPRCPSPWPTLPPVAGPSAQAKVCTSVPSCGGEDNRGGSNPGLKHIVRSLHGCCGTWQRPGTAWEADKHTPSSTATSPLHGNELERRSVRVGRRRCSTLAIRPSTCKRRGPGVGLHAVKRSRTLPRLTKSLSQAASECVCSGGSSASCGSGGVGDSFPNLLSSPGSL